MLLATWTEKKKHRQIILSGNLHHTSLPDYLMWQQVAQQKQSFKFAVAVSTHFGTKYYS